MAGGVRAATRARKHDINLEGYEVRIDSRRIALTYLEFELLSPLVRRASVVAPQQELASAVWGEIAGDRRLSVLICRPRQKLEGSDPWRVKTVRRRGYGLAPE